MPNRHRSETPSVFVLIQNAKLLDIQTTTRKNRLKPSSEVAAGNRFTKD